MKKLRCVAFVACFLSFVVSASFCAQNVGSDAPELSAGTWINADGFKLSDDKDLIVVVEFWATWCSQCRQSIPALRAIYNEYKEKGLILVSLTKSLSIL